MLKPGDTRTKNSRLLFWGAGCVLAFGVGCVLYGAASKTVDDDAEQRFENLARSTQYGIAARIKSYSDLTRSLAAMFQASDEVTRLEFHQYVQTLDLPRYFPAIETLAWAPRVRDQSICRRDRKVDSARRSNPPTCLPRNRLTRCDAIPSLAMTP